MIDFRYHLVSLISVFLALAVGIVLGAGPLREGISDAITGQVDELRNDRDKLRNRLDEAEALAESRNELLSELQPAAISGTLDQISVAIVRLPGAGDGDSLIQALEQAGADITAEVNVSDELVNPDSASFLASYSGQLAGYLEPAPSGNASTEEILGQALAQATAQVGNVDNARTLAEILSSTDPQLVNFSDTVEQSAAAIVVISGASDATETTASPEEVAKATGLSQVSAGITATIPTVLVGDSTAAQSVLATVRSGDLSEMITTVDAVGTTAAAINTPRALRAQIDGLGGHWGIQPGASAVLAPMPEGSGPAASSAAATLPSPRPTPSQSPRKKREPVGAGRR
ncbi:MAG: copper transporter [Bowdeniella nasicola]|nr:copper transporter [Bowdeniella nasicola]